MKTCNDMIHTAKTNTDLKVAVSDGIIAFNGIMFYVNPIYTEIRGTKHRVYSNKS